MRWLGGELGVLTVAFSAGVCPGLEMLGMVGCTHGMMGWMLGMLGCTLCMLELTLGMVGCKLGMLRCTLVMVGCTHGMAWLDVRMGWWDGC